MFSKLMIFMLQMQYNAPHFMYVFHNFFGGDTPDPLLVLGPRIGPPSLQNSGCAPAIRRLIQTIFFACSLYYILDIYKVHARRDIDSCRI